MSAMAPDTPPSEWKIPKLRIDVDGPASGAMWRNLGSALRAMAALVEGPMLLSVYAPTWAPSTKAGVRGGISRWLYGDGAMFLPGLGRVQTFGEAELRNLIERAGMDILAVDTSPAIDNWPHAVVRTPR